MVILFSLHQASTFRLEQHYGVCVAKRPADPLVPPPVSHRRSGCGSVPRLKQRLPADAITTRSCFGSGSRFAADETVELFVVFSLVFSLSAVGAQELSRP